MPEDSPGLIVALILGLVEGLTEFIPVSSTGHLILVGHWLEFKGEFANSFEIFIQLGAILAVVFLYHEKFKNLLKLKNFRYEAQSFSGFSGVLKLFVASIPAFISGFLLHDFIKSNLFFPLTVALALMLGGLLMLFVEKRNSSVLVTKVDELSLKQSFLIGCFQCLALWPGMSRSASTIVGGMLFGCSRVVAAEFSFLMAVPVMVAAVTYDLYKNIDLINLSNLDFLLVGFVVSFISGVWAIKFLIGILKRYSLSPFAYYRIALGGVVVYFCS